MNDYTATETIKLEGTKLSFGAKLEYLVNDRKMDNISYTYLVLY